MTLYSTDDIDTPCTRLGCNISELCTGCKALMSTEQPHKCYRAGRAVRRIIRYRGALSSARSRPVDVWDRLQKAVKSVTVVEITYILKRFYGAQYRGTYRAELHAKATEVYERRRALLCGRPKPRRWSAVAESFGLKVGPDPYTQLMYADTPLYRVLEKRA